MSACPARGTPYKLFSTSSYRTPHGSGACSAFAYNRNIVNHVHDTGQGSGKFRLSSSNPFCNSRNNQNLICNNLLIHDEMRGVEHLDFCTMGMAVTQTRGLSGRPPGNCDRFVGTDLC